MYFSEELMKDKSIPPMSRMLHAKIVALHHAPEGCIAGNEYFAEVLGVVENTISKHMGVLVTESFIQRTLTPKKYGGRERVIIPLKYPNIPKRKPEHTQKGITKPTFRNSELDRKDVPYSNSVSNSVNNTGSDTQLPPELIQEMKNEYTSKDIDKAVSSFYAKNKTLNAENIESRFRKWCNDEHESPKKFAEQFKRDSCGFPMAYCQECGVSASYEEKDLSGESRCCQNKLQPIKPNGMVKNGQWV